MNKAMESKLIEYALHIAKQYKSKITSEQYMQLYNAIKICQEYFVDGKGDWGRMYEAVLDEDGIWEYSELYDFEEEITYMWGLETRILICCCYLGCVSEHDYLPQDMELRGENIPGFVECLEQNVGEKIDFKAVIGFWDKNLCY